MTAFLGGEWSVERAEQLLERTLEHYQRHGFGVWLAEDRQTGEPEVGWWIDADRWGEGLATEGGAAAIDYAFETLRVPRVVSICMEANRASRRVMQKLALEKIAEVPFPELDIVLWVHARSREPDGA